VGRSPFSGQRWKLTISIGLSKNDVALSVLLVATPLQSGPTKTDEPNRAQNVAQIIRDQLAGTRSFPSYGLQSSLVNLNPPISPHPAHRHSLCTDRRNSLLTFPRCHRRHGRSLLLESHRSSTTVLPPTGLPLRTPSPLCPFILTPSHRGMGDPPPPPPKKVLVLARYQIIKPLPAHGSFRDTGSSPMAVTMILTLLEPDPVIHSRTQARPATMHRTLFH